MDQNPSGFTITDYAKAALVFITGLAGGGFWAKSRMSSSAERPVDWEEFKEEIRSSLQLLSDRMDRQDARIGRVLRRYNTLANEEDHPGSD